MTGDHIVQETRIEHSTRDGTDLVEAGCQGDRAVAAHPAVRRLDADRTGDVRGLADRSAGVRAESERCFERGHRRCRAAARAARDAVEIPRVTGRAVRGVLGGRAHRELVHIGLAERHEAGSAGARHDGRVVGRQVALEDLRSARGGLIRRDQDVFDRQRNAGERMQLLPRRACAVDGVGCGQGTVVDVQERVHIPVDGRDPIQERLGGLAAGDLAGGELVCELRSGEADDVAHCSSPRIAVTRKRPSAASGAFCSTCSCVSVSPTSSGRKTFASGIG